MCHVLIIEDEVLIALDLCWVFSCAGATSFNVAETAEAAVYAASVRRPDIITSDVRLRSGSCMEAVSAIQAALGPIPVVFITASPEECTWSKRPFRVLGKPLAHATIAKAFRDLAPNISTPVASPSAGTFAAFNAPAGDGRQPMSPP